MLLTYKHQLWNSILKANKEIEGEKKRSKWDFNLKIAVDVKEEIEGKQKKNSSKRSRSIKLFPVVLIKEPESK